MPLLTIHQELQTLIPPLTAEEYAKLEANILQHGCLDPLIVWAGHDTILDGHHRYRICQHHGIPYTTQPLALQGLDAARAWLIAHQLGRRNLTPEQTAYLRGKQGEQAKHQGRRTDLTSGNDCPKSAPVAETLATQHAVSPRTIKSDMAFARHIDTVAQAVGPDARQALLARDTRLDRRDVRTLALIATASPQTARHVVAAVQAAPTPQRAKQIVHAALKDLPTPERTGAPDGQARRWVETVPASEGRTLYIVHDPESHPVLNLTNDMVDWASWTWNPVTGCWHGCAWCYARGIANNARMAQVYPQQFEPTFYPDRLRAPANTRRPAALTRPQDRNVFVCSMADLFGKWVPEDWIRPVFAEVRAHPAWNFLFLTKFPQRLQELQEALDGFPPNAWLGCTVDTQARVQTAERAFRQLTAPVKWLSVEPMLERITFHTLDVFDWVVMGGLTASPFNGTPAFQPDWAWVEHLWDQARRVGVPVYWKENLTVRPKAVPWSAGA
jgi:protein gp37